MKAHTNKAVLMSMTALIVVYGGLVLWPRPQAVDGVNPLRLTSGQKPLLIAHGGGNHEFPDNTLEAFYNAYRIDPLAMMETDVNLTKDDVVILSHDTTLDRKTNLTYADIREVNYSDLIADEVDFGFANDVEPESNGYNVSETFTRYTTYLGEEVTPLDVVYPEGIVARHSTVFLATTLEELITRFPNNPINVEIKQTGETGLDALEAVIDLMDALDEAYNTYERIVLATFHANVFSRLLQLKATDHPQLQFSPETNGVIKFFALHTLGLSAFYFDQVSVLQLPTERYGLDLSTASLIETAHRHNIAVHYWTIDNPLEMEALFKMGADGVMTNRPSVMKAVLDSYLP